jgi:hypothetical protein
MQRQILAYLRVKVGDSLPHSPAGTENTPRTLGRGDLGNVRGIPSTPTPPDVRGATGKPNKITLEGVLLVAIQRVKTHTTPNIHPHTQALYEAWRGEFLAGGQVLTARGGTRFLHRKIRQEMRETITAGGLDALLALFRAYAFRDGLIAPNPRYTGKAPYPRFVRVRG